MAIELELSPDEIRDMIRETRKNDSRVGAGEIALTPYAIRCIKHGRVILSKTEVTGGSGVGYGQFNMEREYRCPHCGRECRADRYWYDHTVNALSTL